MLYRCSGRGGEAFFFYLWRPEPTFRRDDNIPFSGTSDARLMVGAPLQIIIRVWLPISTIPTLQQRPFMTHKDPKTTHRDHRSPSPLPGFQPRSGQPLHAPPHRPSTNANQHTTPTPSLTSTPRSKPTWEKRGLTTTYHVKKDLGHDIWLYKRCPKRACA